MNTLEIGRRRFLALCGGGVSGIWFAGTGLVRLPAQMVFAMSGSCSFCGKEPHELFGLAGITPGGVRICDECIGLCLSILAEEVEMESPGPQSPPETAPCEDTFDEARWLEGLLRRVAGGEHGDPLLDSLVRAVARAGELMVPPGPRPPEGDFTCSFCGKTQDEVERMIAGPEVFVCDGCVGDAAALFMRYGWRPRS